MCLLLSLLAVQWSDDTVIAWTSYQHTVIYLFMTIHIQDVEISPMWQSQILRQGSVYWHDSVSQKLLVSSWSPGMPMPYVQWPAFQPDTWLPDWSPTVKFVSTLSQHCQACPFKNDLYWAISCSSCSIYNIVKAGWTWLKTTHYWDL